MDQSQLTKLLGDLRDGLSSMVQNLDKLIVETTDAIKPADPLPSWIVVNPTDYGGGNVETFDGTGARPQLHVLGTVQATDQDAATAAAVAAWPGVTVHAVTQDQLDQANADLNNRIVKARKEAKAAAAAAADAAEGEVSG